MIIEPTSQPNSVPGFPCDHNSILVLSPSVVAVAARDVCAF